MARPGALRMVAAVVLLLGLVVAVVLGQRGGGTSSAAVPESAVTPAQAEPVNESTTPPPNTIEPTATESAQPPAQLDVVSEVVVVAEDVVQAWQQQDEVARVDSLRPLVTADYLALAETTDPSRVPQAPIARAGLRSEADGQALVDVELEDGTALAVLLTQSDSGDWLGADVLPVDAGDA